MLPASLVEATERVLLAISTPAPLLGQGALARFIADGHLAAHLRRTRLLYAGRQQALTAAAERHLAGLLDMAPDPGGMHLVARPHADLVTGFDDVAGAAAARAAAVEVSPLSPCYGTAPARHGFLLGYAGVPDAEIEPAVTRLRDALTLGVHARFGPADTTERRAAAFPRRV